ncbi:MAG: outer-membrane lipoprotein carrier protein LolA [Campylobacterales bacterium]|nr:outer-membrane lipoprotein carrier protein LolA [Campylobacterales bacterium]
MKTLILLLAAITTLFGFTDSIRTFSADFTQQIVDDTNKTITYEGHVDATRPDKAHWHYFKPVEKSVFVIGHKVTIIEPELEQAIVKTFRDEIDLFKILVDAVKLDDETYLATHKSQEFLIRIRNDTPLAISYRDAFENNVHIRFSAQKVNRSLDDALFLPEIPAGYDILSE